MPLTPARILVPRLVDAAQTNAQNLNAKALLSRFCNPSHQWIAAHYNDPHSAVANNPRVALARLWRGRLWPWRMTTLYLGQVDAIFYPGFEWFDDLALKLRSRFARCVPIIATFEGLVGDPEREAILSDLAGHAVYCHHVSRQTMERIDRTLHQADHIIALSPFLAKMGARLYGDKFSVLPLGIDAKLIETTLPTSTGCNNPNRCTVIAAGTVYERKRPELFLNLAEQFPAVDFRWIGEGPQRQALLMEAGRRRLHNLSFPGGRSPEGVIAEMKAADIFVLPSKAEGYGKVTQEAAACGLPVIVFGYYEPPPVIDGENGYAVWSDEEFELRLRQLIEDRDRRRAMGMRGKELARAWDWDVIAKQWEDEILRRVSHVSG